MALMTCKHVMLLLYEDITTESLSHSHTGFSVMTYLTIPNKWGGNTNAGLTILISRISVKHEHVSPFIFYSIYFHTPLFLSL
jgi:hypothetical protein